jgi:peptidoglycan/LPS O-acetylase OafA/YrhL
LPQGRSDGRAGVARYRHGDESSIAQLGEPSPHKVWTMSGLEWRSMRFTVERRMELRVRTIGESLDPRHNSLNFLRLVLALAVVVSHASALGGYKIPTEINGTDVAQIAVYGFFGISGYLIAGSACRNGAGRYLWQRFLRIFPAFWACLIVTAFFFGVVAWLYHPVDPRCGITCYFNARLNSPYEYIYRNLLLKVNQNSIAGTPTRNLGVWNGSLWTLYFEFLCYLILMGIALVGLLRRRGVVLFATAALWVAIAVITFTPSLDQRFTLFTNGFGMDILKLSIVFMLGAVIFLYRDRIPDSGLLALGCAGLFAACLNWPNGPLDPALALTKSDLLAPLIAYPLLWLGAHLPFQQVGKDNDYSYGIYIYGFPVAQLLIIFGAENWGLLPYMTVAVVSTLLFAVASWWAVEKHALKLKSFTLTQIRPDPATVVGRDQTSREIRP